MNLHDEHRRRAVRAELAERIGNLIREDGTVQALPGLHLNRASQPVRRVQGVTIPALCIIAQGAKEVYLGESRYRYDPEHYLLATVELPVTAVAIEASTDCPYLSLRLDLEPSLVSSVMVEASIPVPRNQSDAKAVVVSALDSDLMDAALRLIRLIETPADASVLVPLIKREIVYRLLMGEQGHRLRHLPMLGGNSHSIARAIEILRKDYHQPVSVENLARELGMSSSGFHHHFKAITDMSPVQFQKQLRLQEARRLMLGENLDAASAGYRVGYYDASHFSRDYKKHFGEPPARDVEHLRADGSSVAAVSAGAAA